MTIMDKPHLTEQQLADRWGMSIRTLQDWRRRGIGIAYLKLRGAIRYQCETVERYEAAHLKEVEAINE